MNKRQRANEHHRKYGVQETLEQQRKYWEDREKEETRQSDKFLEKLQKIFPSRKLSHYQFRVADKVDIYPRNQKYHILATNERGEYGMRFDSTKMEWLPEIPLEEFLTSIIRDDHTRSVSFYELPPMLDVIAL